MTLQITDIVAIGILISVMLITLAWLMAENYLYKRKWSDRWYSDYDDDKCSTKDCYICKENE